MMKCKRGIAILLLPMLAWVSAPLSAAQREQRQIPWEGLSEVVGHRVSIVMPDGARIQGKALSVETDALAIDISKTPNKSAYPRGRFLVPRATLTAVDVDHSTMRWSLVTIGVTVAIGGFLAVLAISLRNFRSAHAYEPALAAAAVGVPVAGVLLGRHADKRTITYVIKP
jgi:hypothetical protein